MAGGFTELGAVSRVKALRINGKKHSHNAIRGNIKGSIAGNPQDDAPLMPGDVVVVSEGIFKKYFIV